MTGVQPQNDTSGQKKYLHLEAAMAEEGLEEVETYVLFHQNTIAQHIATRPILELCLEAEQWAGARVAH